MQFLCSLLAILKQNMKNPAHYYFYFDFFLKMCKKIKNKEFQQKLETNNNFFKFISNL